MDPGLLPVSVAPQVQQEAGEAKVGEPTSIPGTLNLE